MTEPESAQPYTVVVGVSDSSKSPVALMWAAEQAAQLGGRVVAVRAHRTTAAGPGTRPTTARDPASEARQLLKDLQADVAEVLGPDHGVECRLENGPRLKVLLRAARGADLLVIDAPRATNLLSPPLFANRVVYRADCPVVVMPPGVSKEPQTWLTRVTRTLGSNALRAAGTAGRPGMSGPRHPH